MRPRQLRNEDPVRRTIPPERVVPILPPIDPNQPSRALQGEEVNEPVFFRVRVSITRRNDINPIVAKTQRATLEG